ncbi:MAG: DUF951 domain-containing protein [Chloroflexota bacterium]|nr:DUF951 domain-containing protein [Chloroflexota bacterium]
MPRIVDLHLGDVLTLKKKHPCGGSQWEIVRVGMDVGIVCRACNRRVTLVRSELERRIKFIETDGGSA